MCIITVCSNQLSTNREQLISSEELEMDISGVTAIFCLTVSAMFYGTKSSPVSPSSDPYGNPISTVQGRSGTLPAILEHVLKIKAMKANSEDTNTKEQKEGEHIINVKSDTANLLKSILQDTSEDTVPNQEQDQEQKHVVNQKPKPDVIDMSEASVQYYGDVTVEQTCYNWYTYQQNLKAIAQQLSVEIYVNCGAGSNMLTVAHPHGTAQTRIFLPQSTCYGASCNGTFS